MTVTTAAHDQATPRETALSIRGLRKSFAGVTVLHGVDLDVARGEIHGLIGPNGSGKSTLVKALSGFHRPDGVPDIRIGGAALPEGFDVDDVRRAGCGFVHQDLGLVADSSIADNFGFSAAGFARRRAGRIGWREHHRRVRELLQRVGLDLDPRAEVGTLSPAERTLVAIARALGEFSDEALLVLDEPTAALPQDEVDMLFRALRNLRDQGAALIFISHRLPELLEITDRITVLRDGRVAATLQTGDISRDELAAAMLGGAAEAAAVEEAVSGPALAVTDRHVVLSLTGVRTAGLAPTDLEVTAGEVLVLTGAVGSGAADVGRAAYGLIPTLAGTWAFDGRAFDPDRGPAVLRDLGIAYLPADRAGESAIPLMSVEENILATGYGPFSRTGRIRWRKAHEAVDELVDDYDVLPRDRTAPIGSLSGGNQQKALLAKWLRLRPRLLIADEPTQGIDIATRTAIYSRVRAAAAHGLAVVWITSDFEEAQLVGDRVGIFVHGHLEVELTASQATAERIGHHSLLGASTT